MKALLDLPPLWKAMETKRSRKVGPTPCYGCWPGRGFTLHGDFKKKKKDKYLLCHFYCVRFLEFSPARTALTSFTPRAEYMYFIITAKPWKILSDKNCEKGGTTAKPATSACFCSNFLRGSRFFIAAEEVMTHPFNLKTMSQCAGLGCWAQDNP